MLALLGFEPAARPVAALVVSVATAAAAVTLCCAAGWGPGGPGSGWLLLALAVLVHGAWSVMATEPSGDGALHQDATWQHLVLAGLVACRACGCCRAPD